MSNFVVISKRCFGQFNLLTDLQMNYLGAVYSAEKFFQQSAKTIYLKIIFLFQNFMMRDGKGSIMFLARAFAAINGFTFAIASFFNPGLAYACFQRLMFAFGLASVIRLSQRLGVSFGS